MPPRTIFIHKFKKENTDRPMDLKNSSLRMTREYLCVRAA